jgi:hypothetical protein
MNIKARQLKASAQRKELARQLDAAMDLVFKATVTALNQREAREMGFVTLNFPPPIILPAEHER